MCPKQCEMFKEVCCTDKQVSLCAPNNVKCLKRFVVLASGVRCLKRFDVLASGVRCLKRFVLLTDGYLCVPQVM